MAEIVKSMPEAPLKSTSSTPDAAERALRAAVGSRVQVQTTNPHAQLLDGHVYLTCPHTNLIVITAGNAHNPTFHTVPTVTLASFEVMTPSTNSNVGPPLAPVTNQVQLARANAAISKAKLKASKINKTVDKFAQDLFDGLDKQFGARWKAKDIIVMDTVVIRHPGYRAEDCKALNADGEGPLVRVRKVLENERKRATPRDGWKSVKPAVPNIMPAVPVPQVMRKGG